MKNLKTIISIFVGVMILIVGYILANGQMNQSKDLKSGVAVKEETAYGMDKTLDKSGRGEGVFEFGVENNKLATGSSSIQVKKDEEIKLLFRSDKSHEIHLHGYDNRINLNPGEVGEMRLKTDISGRFEIEIEDLGTTISVLEVLPK